MVISIVVWCFLYVYQRVSRFPDPFFFWLGYSHCLSSCAFTGGPMTQDPKGSNKVPAPATSILEVMDIPERRLDIGWLDDFKGELVELNVRWFSSHVCLPEVRYHLGRAAASHQKWRCNHHKCKDMGRFESRKVCPADFCSTWLTFSKHHHLYK